MSAVLWILAGGANRPLLRRRRRRIDGAQGDRQPVDARSLTRTARSSNGECPLPPEASVGIGYQEIRTPGGHGPVGPGRVAKVGIVAAGFPAAVIPRVGVKVWR